jgi:hypothetical protein
LHWTKDAAIEKLRRLREEIEHLKDEEFHSAALTKWRMRVLRCLEEVFGQDSRYYLTFANLKWPMRGVTTGGRVVNPLAYREVRAVFESENRKEYRTLLEVSHGILAAAEEELSEAEDISDVYRGKDTPAEASLIIEIINFTEQKLRKVIREPPVKEKEVQDAFENLLIGRDIDYTREKETVPYSSKHYKPDFVVARIDLAIEIKLCNKDTREKEIIGEINDDIQAYGQKWSNLFFIVYDTGFIRDVDVFRASFESNPKTVVRVVKQ